MLDDSFAGHGDVPANEKSVLVDGSEGSIRDGLHSLKLGQLRYVDGGKVRLMVF